MQHKETIANNYSIFIYLFRYMSSVDKNASISPVTLHREAGCFLMPLSCVGPAVQKCDRHVKILNMSGK